MAGLLIPEPLGGAGASYRELAAAAEQFGAAVAPIPYLGSAAVATAVLLSAARATPDRPTPRGMPAARGRPRGPGLVAAAAARALLRAAWPTGDARTRRRSPAVAAARWPTAR